MKRVTKAQLALEILELEKRVNDQHEAIDFYKGTIRGYEAQITTLEYKLAGFTQARDFWERESRWWQAQYRRVAEQLNLPWYTRLWQWAVSLV